MAVVPAIAAATLLGTWLDKRYNIISDIEQIRCMRRQQKYWKYLCKIHGTDDWSYYHTIHCTYGTNEYDEAFLFEDRSWTYAQFRGEVGRLALAFQERGIGNRTVVGMYINNSPEFMFCWWALYKIGAIPAPVNTSITEEPFRHCFRASSSEYLVCSYELIGAVQQSLNGHDVPPLKEIILYNYNTYAPVTTNPNIVLISQNDLPPVTPAMASWPPSTRPKVGPEDTSQYLFTSGTTGLPKASIWPVGHASMGASRHRWPMMFNEYRRTYICTPLFHGGATFALLPTTFSTGGTIVLVRKFSLRTFWPDMRRTKCNMMFYIGEMIRYLVQAAPDPLHPDETQGHNLQVIFGLGLTAPIWRQFRLRFGVPWIAEYYGASEGTTAICNSNKTNDSGVAKVAHFGPLMRSKLFGQRTFYIIKIDLDTLSLLRDPATGLCIKAGPGEVGEAINRIVPPLQRSHDYVGSAGQKATNDKLITDVFEKGDLFWRMGDALSMDKDGYVSFHDRLGDTFRAKGHNISTAEVESAFINHPTVAAANVFAIPMSRYGYEGQVGCAALSFKPSTTSSNEIAKEIGALEPYLLKVGLASYALPRFLRVLVDESDDLGNSSAEDVGTERTSLIMKKLKTGLRREGLEVAGKGSRDLWFWLEREGRGYENLDEVVRKEIVEGKARL